MGELRFQLSCAQDRFINRCLDRTDEQGARRLPAPEIPPSLVGDSMDEAIGRAEHRLTQLVVASLLGSNTTLPLEARRLHAKLQEGEQGAAYLAALQALDLQDATPLLRKLSSRELSRLIDLLEVELAGKRLTYVCWPRDT